MDHQPQQPPEEPTSPSEPVDHAQPHESQPQTQKSSPQPPKTSTTPATEASQPPRRPWERPTASNRPPSTTQAAEDDIGGPTDSTHNAARGRMLSMAAAAVEAAKADRFASIRTDPTPDVLREGTARTNRLPISRKSMEHLARIVADGNAALDAGLYRDAEAHCRAILKHPSATPEQRNYAANVARGLVALSRQAANDLDPMEVSEGLHQHAAGVEVTEGGTAKVEATYTFKVSIS